MTQYLLDTNIILRFSNPLDAQHELVTQAIYLLLTQGDECYLTPQVRFIRDYDRSSSKYYSLINY